LKIPNDSFVHPTATVNEQFRWLQSGKACSFVYDPCEIGARVYIGAGAVIGAGSRLNDGVVVDHRCIVEPGATIGENTLLTYGCIIGSEAEIGSECVIGGFVAERCRIGRACRVFGKIAHTQADTTRGWDDESAPEPSAIVGDSCFVGFQAVIAGGVEIGARAYVCAGAIVTRNIPSRHIAFGTNQIVPAQSWKGQLRHNPVFRL
jgi:acetyltransferase-like isoleucine patch superfamily enzyme